MTQAFLDNYRLMARYNQWFNDKLYRACEKLSEDQRRQDRGAFFGSIHNTLNHLVVTDQIWMRRLATQGVVFQALSGDVLNLTEACQLNGVPYAAWAELVAKREQMDAAIVALIAEMPEDFPFATMRYSNTKGVSREHPVWQAVTHWFNHQTHHRGQTTTLLMQAGVDVGVTDLLAVFTA